MRNVKNYFIAVVSAVAVLIGIFAMPKMGFAQGYLRPQQGPSSILVGGDSSASSATSFVEDSSIGDGSVISGSEAPSTSGSAVEPSLPPPELQIIPGAEATIRVALGQTLVLGEAGSFIFRTDGGVYEDIPVAEWETPIGHYDSATNVVFEGETGYLRSVVTARINSISGTDTNLVIVGTSDIRVFSTAAVAVDINSLTIAEDGFEMPTKIAITALKIGIQTLQSVTIGSNVAMSISAAENAILQVFEVEAWTGYVVSVFHGSVIELAATGESGIALHAENMEVYGASVTALAPSGVGGIKLARALMVKEAVGFRGSIDASSANGRAISCGDIDMTASSVRGVTPGGNVGVHADQYINASTGTMGSSSIYGKSNAGYGVVANNIAENAEYPSGSIYMDGGIIEGHVNDGMGISSNTISMNGSYETLEITRLLGTAQKGIGISVCMLSANYNAHVEGVSLGASGTHYQVYGSIPDCAGISVLSSANVGEKGTLIGRAPKDVAGSFGIHCLLIQEGGYPSGSMSIYGIENALATIIASGETAIYVFSISVNQSSVVEADGSLDGLVATSINMAGDGAGARPLLRAKGESGIGIKASPISEQVYTSIYIISADVVATGGEYGFFMQTEGSHILQDVSLVAKATGANAVAGLFIQLYIREDMVPQALEVAIVDSHIEASSPRYGCLFIDSEVTVSASNFKLQKPGHLKGEGGECGIKLQYSAALQDEFTPAGKMALKTTDMVLPNGERYVIWGVSTSTEPDIFGRKAAISLPSSDIGGGGIFREEYTMLAKETLTANNPFAIYAQGMNVVGFQDFSWHSPESDIITHTEGLTADGNGVFGARILGERQTGAGGSASVVLTQGTHEIRLLADINIATIVFHGKGGEPENSHLRVPMGYPIGDAPKVSKIGSEFLHWLYADGDVIWDVQNDTVTKQHMELFAEWKTLNYKLLFDANAGGDEVQNMPSLASLIMGALLPKPNTVPERNKAQFMHWSTSPEGGGIWDFENGTMPAKDMTLYAVWQTASFTITYDATGGMPSSQSETVVANSPIPGTITEPTRENFVFTGWFEDVEATISWQAGGAMPSKDFAVYAGWRHEYINVTFDAGGGDPLSLPEAFKARPGEEIQFTEYQPGSGKSPLYDKHVFLGWHDDAGNVFQDISTAPSHDVHLVAQWEEIILPIKPEDIVVYLGSKTRDEIESGIKYSYSYTDLLNREHTLMAKPQWNADVLGRGGVVNIALIFESTNGDIATLKEGLKIYVLMHAKITSQHSQTFMYGQDINLNGSEWEARSFTQYPNFGNGTIGKSAMSLVFHINGTNSRISGKYAPYFTAVYADYFGVVQSLKHDVEAIVLPSGGGQSFDYWGTVAAQMRSQTSAKNMLITAVNYPIGGDTILFAPEIFSRRIVARPGPFILMTADALASVKDGGNAQLQVELGWLTWFMNTGDFEDGKRHSGVYPLKVTAGTDQEKLEEYASEYNAMPLQFEMNKSWNGSPTMQVKVNTALAQSAKRGNTLYAFWFNTVTQRLELVGDMADNGGGKFSVRMKSVHEHYIILDKLPLDENGKPDFDISDKTNPLSEELEKIIDELFKDEDLGIIEEPEIGVEEETPMISMLFPSWLCIIIIIILLIIIAILLFLYLKARRKLKKLLNQDYAKFEYEDNPEIDFAGSGEAEAVEYTKKDLHEKYIPTVTKEDLYSFDDRK